jgi:NADH:ubiquinone oxidoreductase subunit 3 (subunit A)
MNTSFINIVLAMVVIIFLGVAAMAVPKFLDRNKERREELTIHVVDLRSRIAKMPPGGALELMVEELRKSEEELESLR